MPWLTVTDTFDFDEGVDRSALRAHLAECLRKVDASAVDVSPSTVSFRGGFFRWTSNSNVLNQFGRGELIVNEAKHEVRYLLSIRELVSAAAILAAIGFVSVWFDAGHGSLALAMCLLGGACLVGINLAIGLPRFQRFLRAALDSLPPPKG